MCSLPERVLLHFCCKLFRVRFDSNYPFTEECPAVLVWNKSLWEKVQYLDAVYLEIFAILPSEEQFLAFRNDRLDYKKFFNSLLRPLLMKSR